MIADIMSKSRAKKAGCGCVAGVDKTLSEFNTVLSKCYQLNGSQYLVIATNKIDSRKRSMAKTVVATYCPFCGKRFKPGKLK